MPHFFDHVKWVVGRDTIEEALEVTDGFTLNGITEKITVPILVTHGADDAQVPVEKAHKTYD